MRFRFTALPLFAVSLLGPAAIAQPNTSYPGQLYVAHSASNVPPSTAETGLAPGSIADVNLQALRFSGAIGREDRLDLSFRRPGDTETSGIQVLRSFQSPDGLVSAFQVLIPEDAQSGEGEIVLRTGVRRFSQRTFINPNNFGIFRDLNRGYSVASTGKTFTAPAIAGEVITFWGTGLGAPARWFDVRPEVLVYGQPATVLYAGPAPSLPGVDQLNVQLPAQGVPDDCYVPVTVRVGGRGSIPVTIPFAGRPGPCRHPLNLSPQALATLDRGETTPIVTVDISSAMAEMDHPGAERLYRRSDYVQVLLNGRGLSETGLLILPLLAPPDQIGCSAAPAGLGSLGGFIRVQPLESNSIPPALQVPHLGLLELDGALGIYSRLLQRSQPGAPQAVPPSMLPAGPWILTRPASPFFAEIVHRFTVPPPLRWSDLTMRKSVRRGEPFEILWDKTGYSENDIVTTTMATTARAITCRGRASMGQIQVPADLLFSDGQPVSGSEVSLSVELRRGREDPMLFSVRLQNGGEAPGLVRYAYYDSLWLRVE